jgi:trimethylamine:corrinoid methyltransferase-like protein
VLTRDEIEDIHQATLEVLEQTGVFGEADDALDVYADGATDMYERARVRAIELLESHQPPEIDADIKAAMEAHMKKCDEEVGGA